MNRFERRLGRNYFLYTGGFTGFVVLLAIGEECTELLRRDDGLDIAMDRIAAALGQGLRETAYLLACDVVAADGSAVQDELRLLEMLRKR